MAIEVEILKDDMDPDEECFIIRYEGRWLGRIRKLEDGWEARTNEGMKGPIHYSSADRAVQALVFGSAL